MRTSIALFTLFRLCVVAWACLLTLAIVGCTRGETGGVSLGVSYSTYVGGGDCDAIAVDLAGNTYVACHVNPQDLPTTHELVSEQADVRQTQAIIVAKLDPTGSQLLYVTRVAGSRNDVAVEIAVDSAGSAYVTGRTASADFPTTEGALQRTYGGGFEDLFILKLDPSGAVVLSTFLGGHGRDHFGGIAVDHAGNIYVTGLTESDDFPTAHAFQGTNAGGFDAFVAKLDPTGSSLIYSTYLGGTDTDMGSGIAVGPDGSAYVLGGTQSHDFPTANAFQPNFGGGASDDFVTKLDPTGSSLVYSTYLGGSGREQLPATNPLSAAIAVDAAGSAYVAGTTASSDFPTRNPLQATPGGGVDLFVTKLDPTGSSLIYSTYLGGSGDERSDVDLAVDTAGNAYVATKALALDFPILNPLRPTLQHHWSHSSVAKLDPQGSALVWSTYVTGMVEGVALGPDGSVHLTGATGALDFPVKNALQAAHVGGGNNIIVTKISQRRPAASALVDSLPTPAAVAEITDLGGPNSGARGINSSGVVVGERARRPILWTPEGRIVELGGYGIAHAVNDREQVVGETPRPSGGEGESFLWTAAAGRVDLATLIGGDFDLDRVLGLADRNGDVEFLNAPPNSYSSPRVSPLGDRVAVQTGGEGEEGSHIWIYDLSGETQIRQLTQVGSNIRPIWTPDGERITFASDRDGPLSIYWQPADGRGVPERLTTPEEGTSHWPESWSPDGRTLSFTAFTTDADNDGAIWTLSLDGGGDPTLFLDLPGSGEMSARFSPDGQWLAYTSGVGGKGGVWQNRGDQHRQVFVKPFPDTGAQYQVTQDTGAEPGWSRDGTEIFYRSRYFVGNTRPISMVDVATESGVSFGAERELPIRGHLTFNGSANYDIMPDGERFVMVFPVEQTDTGDSVRLRIFRQQLQRRPHIKTLLELVDNMPIRARAINARGVVVGRIITDLRRSMPGRDHEPGWTNSFSWSSEDGSLQLGERIDIPWGVNGSGQAVGEAATPRRRQGVRAVLWSGDEVTNLGTLGGSISRAFGINDRGDMVGESLTAAGEKHAFLWTDAQGMLDLGTLGGPTSAALAINNQGQVVGYSTNASEDRRPFLWTAGQGMADLGTLGGTEGIARAINEAGQIVGESLTAAGARHATLWALPARPDR
ncbi:SBBP repeat-containing protein [Acidobacteria bacterium AH-259-L09]|nr:SBBP repeat-containing protein [Acidobacteria bacterium AH-259-L09]